VSGFRQDRAWNDRWSEGRARRSPVFRVRELLLMQREPYWGTIMSLLLILLAVFFGMVAWSTGARLRRMLRAAAGGRRFFGMRTVSD
jgi:hypothetical protein